MQRRLLRALGFLAFALTVFPTVEPATALDKIKFPYSPISYHSLPWLVAYEAKLFEKHGLEVDLSRVAVADRGFHGWQELSECVGRQRQPFRRHVEHDLLRRDVAREIRRGGQRFRPDRR